MEVLNADFIINSTEEHLHKLYFQGGVTTAGILINLVCGIIILFGQTPLCSLIVFGCAVILFVGFLLGTMRTITKNKKLIELARSYKTADTLERLAIIEQIRITV